MLSIRSSQLAFDHLAEHLVVDGFRLCQQISPSPEAPNSTPDVQRFFEAVFESADAKLAGDALLSFAQTIEACSTCPLAQLSKRCHDIAPHELLLLGLIAGIQHDDSELIATCLKHLTCQSRCSDVAYAASVFAITLRSLGQVLNPFTLTQIKTALSGNETRTLH